MKQKFSRKIKWILSVVCLGFVLDGAVDAATIQKVDKKNNRALILFTDEEITKIIRDRSIELVEAEGSAKIVGVITKVNRKQKLALVTLDASSAAPKVKMELTLNNVGTKPVSGGQANPSDASEVASEAEASETEESVAAAATGEKSMMLGLGAGLPVDDLLGFAINFGLLPKQSPLSYNFKYSFATKSNKKDLPSADAYSVSKADFSAQLLEFQARYKVWNNFHAMLAPGYRWYGAEAELASKVLGDSVKVELATRSIVMSAAIGTSWVFKNRWHLNLDLVGYTYPFTKSTGSKIAGSSVFSTSEKAKLQKFYDNYADYLGSKSNDRFLELQFSFMF